MTAAELKAEIESRPELASLWADVFPDEPEPPFGPHPGPMPRRTRTETDEEFADRLGEWNKWDADYQPHARWERIRSRFGELKPDAAHDIAAALTMNDRYVSPQQVAEAKGVA